jgi:selenocysteine-specific elongation factor
LNNNEIIKVNDELFMLNKTVELATQKIKEFIKMNESISIAQGRDLLGTNRKIALGILEYLDNIKITKRDGEKRILIIN